MSEQKAGSGKAVALTGGGGIGIFLIKLCALIQDPTYRDVCIASVPVVSVLLTELFSFTWVIYALDPKQIRLQRELKRIKKQVQESLSDENLSAEMREKAQARYDVIKGIEMGIYPITFLDTGTPSATSSPKQPDLD
ncbi:hypothetical protein [Serratia marcescens]|uniref:hypothetical protein n=1 Tax=Serratia marcescens TaxID=615 RepID=UPI0032046D85